MIVFIYSVIFIFIFLFIFLYRYITCNYGYWKEKGISYEKPVFMFGFIKDNILRKKAMNTIYNEIYNKYPKDRMVGVYNMRIPELVVKDLDDVKTVLISDFNHFMDRGNFVSNDPISKNLFSVNSDMWKSMRQKLTPVFTSGKLKNMVPLMTEVGEEFTKYLKNCADTQGEIECKEVMAKFTTDVIGTCVFGIKMNTMLDEDNQFRIMGRKIFQINFYRLIRLITRNVAPPLFNILTWLVPLSKSNKFFLSIVKQTIDERVNNGKKRNDFIDLMIDLRSKEENLSKENHFNNLDKPLKIDDSFVAAQSLLFFAAGHETSSSIMAFTLHELALNPDIQEKVYQEIKVVMDKYDNKITYDLVYEMKYLEMVIDESQRKHPVVSNLTRMCSSSYTFSDMNKAIDKGVFVTVPVHAIHHDSNYYPDPEKFNPERFTEEEKQKRHPMAYLPFGAGPRNCIGLRFGKMQVKIGLIVLLKDYIVEPCSKTVPVVKYNPSNIIPSSINGLWLKIKKRNII